MPLPLTVSCFSKVQIGFAFLVPAYPGSPGKGPLNGCGCVGVSVIVLLFMYVPVFPSCLYCQAVLLHILCGMLVTATSWSFVVKPIFKRVLQPPLWLIQVGYT